MPTITDRSTQITELATQAAAELSAMMKAANKRDKKASFEAYRDVLRLIGRTSINEFEGRTALLTGLVAELTEVTRSVKVKPAVAKHLDTLAGFTEKALDLIKAEKDAGGST